MDEGQCQSDSPMRRGGTGEAELLSEGLARSPDQNHNRLLEEGEEVEQGPQGGHRILQDSTNNNHTAEEEEDEDEDEAYEEGSKVEEEEDEEDIDSNSGAFSPEPDSQIHDSPSPSPSPTVSEGSEKADRIQVKSSAQELSPSLAECMCALEREDNALLPLTLHQVAEALVLQGDYQRAIRFLQLERLYHQRVLSNIATLQEQWESKWRLVDQYDSCSVSDCDWNGELMERLRHICTTHTRPQRNSQTCELVTKGQRNSVISVSSGERESESPCSSAESEKLMEEQKSGDDLLEEYHSSLADQQGETESHLHNSSPSLPASSFSATPSLDMTDSSLAEGGEEEVEERPADFKTRDPEGELSNTGRPKGPRAGMEGGGESLDTGQHPDPDQTEITETAEKARGGKREEEEVEEAVEALELEPGEELQELLDLEVPELRVEEELEEEGHSVETLGRTDTLDDLAKRIQVEEINPAAGLVSILKRRVSLEGTSGTMVTTTKPPSKRKVRFRVPDDGLDHDDVAGDSWLLLLLLCLATVVISVGGTALYCTFGDAQSSVCMDFSNNMDFYVGQVQRGMEELRHWLNRGS